MDTANRSTGRDRMLAGLGVTVQVREVRGVRTSVIELGAGPPLVLLHGAVECGGAIWSPVLLRLAERHRVLVPDLPGLGESSPVDRLDVDRFAGWFTALLQTTDTRQPTVVAHSLGGSLAARAAARWGQLVRRLVIYAAPAVGPYRMPLPLRYVAVRFALRPTPRNAERFERFALHDLDATRRRHGGWFEAFEADNLSRAAVPHVKKTMTKLITTQTARIPDPDLERIQAPVVLLWGRHDRMVPLPTGQAAAGRHGWPLHVIERAGHVPHLEQPDAFLDALSRIEATANGR